MRLILVGDVMLGRLVNEVLKQKPPSYPWGDTLEILSTANYRLINLECVISDHGVPWKATPKEFHFRSDSKNIEVLKIASVNAVSLANNHVLDFEYEAMFELLEILKRTGISYTGAGKNLKEASSVTISKVKGKRIGLLAFSDNEPDWEALPNRSGIFYVPIDLKDKRAKVLLENVRKAKKEVDLLIVSAHWGPNWGYLPPPEHIPFAHTLIEAGADIIFGHSGHVFRGIEIYQNRPIIYCAGDFIDDYAVDEIERNDQSFIFVIETNTERVTRILLYPTVIREFQARLARDFEKEEIINKMQVLCKKLNTKTKISSDRSYLEVVII